MPGTRCAVRGCKNSRGRTKAMGLDIIYHGFPRAKDPVSSARRKQWIEFCKRPDEWNPNNCQICCRHFDPEFDYERDLRNELLGIPVRRILKKTAVPCLNLPPSDDEENNSEPGKKKPLKGKQKSDTDSSIRREKRKQKFTTTNDTKTNNKRIRRKGRPLKRKQDNDINIIDEHQAKTSDSEEKRPKRRKQKENTNDVPKTNSKDCSKRDASSAKHFTLQIINGDQSETLKIVTELDGKEPYNELLQKYENLKKDYMLFRRNTNRKIRHLTAQLDSYKKMCPRSARRIKPVTKFTL